jgi:PIN domain nuclease of toxin-antitoxin system
MSKATEVHSFEIGRIFNRMCFDSKSTARELKRQFDRSMAVSGWKTEKEDFGLSLGMAGRKLRPSQTRC